MNDAAAKLFTFSTQLIGSSQFPEGAWHASSGYPTYEYCWFRDSSYVAYAMDIAGEHEASQRFHSWCFRIIGEKLSQWEGYSSSALFIPEKHLIHTRYTHDGRAGEGFWENHQLDGLGTWLWALQEHLEMTGDRIHKKKEQDIIASLCRYLIRLWQYPCYDLWEEYGDNIHLYTLVSVYTGLQRAQQLVGGSYDKDLADIRAFIDKNMVVNGHYAKMTGDTRVDASALGLLVPYRYVHKDDEIFLKTLETIEKTIVCDRGVYRYSGDEFYGGGRWIIHSCWLGLNYIEIGAYKQAESIISWVLAQSDADFLLPEQNSEELQAPQRFPYWQARWGSPAKPLLWSHAMYILLYTAAVKHGLLKR